MTTFVESSGHKLAGVYFTRVRLPTLVAVTLTPLPLIDMLTEPTVTGLLPSTMAASTATLGSTPVAPGLGEALTTGALGAEPEINARKFRLMSLAALRAVRRRVMVPESGSASRS